MQNTIYFRFEKYNISQPPLNNSEYRNLPFGELLGNFLMETQKGFRFSQVVESMVYYHANSIDNNEVIKFERIDSPNPSGYIIPVAVQYHPDDWSDVTDSVPDPTKKSIFELINPIYLKDLRQGKALFLIDQSVEGYHTPWLWEWFHDKCKLYNIPPAAIIYSTGDQSSSDSYLQWCTTHGVTERIKVIPSISLSIYIHKHYQAFVHTDFDEIVQYKEANKDSLFLFDCLNKRPRPQRVLNYLHLLNSGLIDKGNISMSDASTWKPFVDIRIPKFLEEYGLPARFATSIDVIQNPKAKFSENAEKRDSEFKHYYQFVERILDQVYKNSWVSLLVESSFFKYENNVFISEKTFKPIACMQPFIMVGSKHSLKYLRKLGYKSFSPFIDESYDQLDDKERFLAIVKELQRIDKIEDKVSWYKGMREIVEHNFNVFSQIGKQKSQEHLEIAKYYSDYFKGSS